MPEAYPPGQYVKDFLNEIWPIAKAVCPAYGIDPEMCVRKAGELSRWGADAPHFNYFGFKGRGDVGTYMTLHMVMGADGTESPRQESRAKFSSPQAAITAWCQVVGG